MEATRGPLAALEPLPLPSALAAGWLLRSRVRGGDWAAAGTAAGSRAQHCHYLTQQEQCWAEGRELRAEAQDVIGPRNRVSFFLFNLVITFYFQVFFFFFLCVSSDMHAFRCLWAFSHKLDT